MGVDAWATAVGVDTWAAVGGDALDVVGVDAWAAAVGVDACYCVLQTGKHPNLTYVGE